jgi:HSP20 family protein
MLQYQTVAQAIPVFDRPIPLTDISYIRRKTMAIVRWSPIRELEDMRRNLDKLFGEFVEPVTRTQMVSKGEPGNLVPSVDIYDRKGEIVIKADLPGVGKEHIDLTITKDALTIRAEAKKDDEIKREEYYLQERSRGTYVRTIQLPQDVDSSKAKASFQNGVLEITLPKKEEAKATEIKVDIS